VRTWIALLVVLAAIAAALVFGLGLLDGGSGDEEPGDTPAEPAAESPGGGDEEPGDGDPTLRTPGADEGGPDTMPPLEAAPIRSPLGVLLLVGVPQRFNMFLAQQWGGHPEISVHSWAAPLPEGPREGVPSGEVLPGALSAPPRAATLDDENIDVVVLHDMDPAELDREFWLEVADRVAEGRLGLLVIPGLQSGPKMLGHDVLSTVLPVAKATPIEGQPVPGTFQGMASYVPTDAGVRHPASRLVSWPSWSRRIWNARALLETPWGTNVCYPVEEVAPGASVLLDAKPQGREPLPALIVGDPANGRVLWFGGWDLGGRHAYGRPAVASDWQTLVRNWAAWLGGQVDED